MTDDERAVMAYVNGLADGYRLRAEAAEAALAMVRGMIQGLPDHPWIPGDQGSQWPALLEALGVTTDTEEVVSTDGTVTPYTPPFSEGRP